MSEATYMVVFRGELIDGADLDEVKESLQRLCKLTRDRVEQLFSMQAVVLKKNISQELAEAFTRQLEKIGVVTEVSAMNEAKVIALGAHSHSSGAAAKGEAEAGGRELLPLQFHGRGGEYFKIWIVNVLLTILTLGIYSAWAKVRNHRYFYGNTRLGNASFDYTANPVAILKGRIVAVIFLLLFNYSATVLPALYGVLSILFLIAFPWLVNRALAFRNRNTVYRNVRFGFDGSYLGALKAFVLWPIAGALTLGLLMPYAVYAQKSYMVQCSRYGSSHFEPGFGWRDVYGVALRALLIFIAAAALAMLAPLLGPLSPLLLLVAIGCYLVAFAYFSANINNVIYNASSVAGHGFESTLETRSLALLYFTNWLLVAFTLGLAMPWAKVRLAHYRAAHLSVAAEGTLDNFAAAEEEQVGAWGEEIGQAFDIDIGL